MKDVCKNEDKENNGVKIWQKKQERKAQSKMDKPSNN